jgi:GTP cyclohydrolase I
MRYQKIESYDPQITEKLAENYTSILSLIGEDLKRDGLCDSPERMAQALLFFTQGYEQDPQEIIKSAMFEEDYRQMVVVKDIDIYSLCEHHLVPFFGKAHIAYIPNGRICGLSKIPRMVEAYARRLQVQERLTRQIKECLQQTLNPLGVAVVIEARHLCMSMRGVQKQNSITTTSDFSGAFLKNLSTRDEFMQLISADLIKN